MQQLETNLAQVRKQLRLSPNINIVASDGTSETNATNNTNETNNANETKEEEGADSKKSEQEEKAKGKGKKQQQDLKLHKPIAKECILVLNKVFVLFATKSFDSHSNR
jgi:hypothetical protein